MKLVFLILSGVIFTGLLYLFEGQIPELIHPLAWKINLFLLLLTIFSIKITLKLVGNGQSALLVLLVTVFRMLLALSFVAVAITNGFENKILFGINFFILYLIYLSFDIYCLITNLHANLKRSGDKHEMS